MSACNARDLGLIPGLGRSPEEGNGNPLQYSCLENPMDGGAWWATVHWVTKSGTQLSYFTFTFFILILKMEEKSNNFGILCLIMSRKVKTQLTHTQKFCAEYGESAVTEQTCPKWSARVKSLMLEISLCIMLHSQVDQLKWTAIKLRH